MRIKNLINHLVGTSKIIFNDAFEDATTKAIIIIARLPKKEQRRCGICGQKATLYDNLRKNRRWRCNDIGATQVYIETQLHRVNCLKHGVITAAIPWARHKSRFCRNFEETVTWLAVHASKKFVAELMRIEWHTVGALCSRVYNELESKTPSRFDGLVSIGIDETSYKKGHKYMMVVVDHETSAVVWCSKCHGKEVLPNFSRV